MLIYINYKGWVSIELEDRDRKSTDPIEWCDQNDPIIKIGR